jgi:hypothetical protein
MNVRGGIGRCLRRALPVLLACGMLPAHAAGAALTVQVSGRVAHAGSQALPDGVRLADAVIAAQVLPDAYVPGGAWLRPRLRDPQARLKAGVLYELGVLEAQARLDGDTALMELAARLQQQLRALPVTGRQPGALLDPRPLEISDQNYLLGNGDRIVYPLRPASVRVTGAVHADCALPHVPLQDARRYLHDCALAAAADPSWLYIIQPDGTVQRQGIAAWNRDPPRTLAPGAVLYVPILERALPATVRDDTNADIAAFLATQPLPETGS